MQRILVLAPHADDEVLGAGGTLARMIEGGAEAFVAVITRPKPPLFPEGLAEQVRGEARAAHAILGIKETLYLGFPAAEMDLVPHREVNAELGKVMNDLRPDTLMIPHPGDLHMDHQRTTLSALVAARPHPGSPVRTIWAYETLSETNWNAPYLSPAFLPNTWVSIEPWLEKKIEAMKQFGTQIKAFPNERSLEAVRALAALRGATVGCPAAEAFVSLRQVLL